MTSHRIGTGTRSALPAGRSRWPVPAGFLMRSSRLNPTRLSNVSIVKTHGSTSPALASSLRSLWQPQTGPGGTVAVVAGLIAAVKLRELSPERYRAGALASEFCYL
jgi:hypothetical protein